MCIRSAFNTAVVRRLADETMIAPDDAENTLDLVARAPDHTFAHPLALARHLVKHGAIDDDYFGECAKVIGQVARGYKRLRQHHGDLFAGTPHALPPLGKPMLASGYKRLARRTRRQKPPSYAPPARKAKLPRDRKLERKYRAALPKRVTPEQRAAVEAFVATIAAARGVARDFGPNVVDLVALRANRGA